MTIFGRILEKLFKLEPEIKGPKCESCAYFQHLFEQELMRSERMVETLAKLGHTNPTPAPMISPEAYKPLPSKYTPWSVVKNQLEKQDRALAEQQRSEDKTRKLRAEDEARITKLEKELEIPEVDPNASKVG